MLEEDNELPFGKYATIKGKRVWILNALRQIGLQYRELQVNDADFDTVLPDEWNPIPLDRGEPELQTVITAVDEVIEAVRSDNGYAATVPEERKFVLDGLSVLAMRLKASEAVSVPFLRTYAIEPFVKLLKRFGGTAIELAVAAAKEALKEWLKTKGISWLEWL